MGSLRARARAAKVDDGFTLVELLVVISITLVVLIGATGMMITVQKVARSSSARNSDTVDAAIAVQTISRYLQSTTAICGADDNVAVENTCEFMATGVKDNGEIAYNATYKDMWFFTNWDVDDTISSVAKTSGVGPIAIAKRPPWRIHLYVAPNADLKADIYRSTGDMTASCCSWPATPSQTALLAHDVVATPPSGTSTGAPFSYWQHTSPVPTTATQTPGGWPAQPSTVGSPVDQVNLDIVVAHRSNPVVPATEITDTVSLVNRAHDAGEWKTFP